jgi:hypothetical protein
MISYGLIFACFPWMHEIAKAHPTVPGTLDSQVWVVMGFLVVSGMIDMGYSAFNLSFTPFAWDYPNGSLHRIVD